MQSDLNAQSDRRAQILAALAEPVRMTMVDRLLYDDASPSELGSQVGLASNLLAHHLRVLESAGVIRRVRSEGDGRRSYIQLRVDHPLVVAAAHSGPDQGRSGLRHASSLLFVCTANSARSQLAAAVWNQLDTVPAMSAGTHPGPRIHPRALATAGRHGLQLAAARPVAISARQPGASDLVIAVCDSAHEELAPDPARLHWAIPDPVRVDTDAAFDAAYVDIASRVSQLGAVWDADRAASSRHRPS